LAAPDIHKRFYRAVKSKVIIGFLVAFFALVAAWLISKYAFGQMLNTVEEISKPNRRLHLVNDLSQDIGHLDQLQRKDQNGKAGAVIFFRDSRRLKNNLDTLAKLYGNNKTQLSRIKSIKNLLIDRDKQLLNYLKVRESLVHNKSFSDEVKSLNYLVSKRSKQADSAVLTTETTTNTTTLAPDEEEKSRSFLSRIFGRKKADAYKIITEELKIKRDTFNAAVEDSIVKSMETVLRKIELEQKIKSEKFLKQESDLSMANTKLTQKMLQILHEVEAEAVSQVDLNGLQAKQVVNKGISQITFILIASFLLILILLYFILTDITKTNKYRKELELAKEEAEYHGKAKQRFLSNMSHEIRTPLQSILGYAEQINQQVVPNKENVNAIYQSSIHLLQIVNEILDYNRIISGEFKFNKQPFKLKNLLNDVVSIMKPMAQQKGLNFLSEFDFDEDAVLSGDPFRLKQILLNVLGNAIKFTLKGDVLLKVAGKKHADLEFVTLTVKDTGIGFSEEDLPRIFNEFEQIESQAKYEINQTGAGLGLTIVKALVENQNGQIGVKSKINEGTLFSINLKFELSKEMLTEELKAESFNFDQLGTVWFIDDDRFILDLCALILQKNKIKHKSFIRVEDILNENAPINLQYVFIDMRMPEMQGVELCKILKKRLPANVKFYAMTAQVLPEERAIVYEQGFDGIILKPFKEQEILSILGLQEIAEKPEFDLSTVQKMTFGDAELLEKILTRFEQDCLNDIDELNSFILKEDRENCSLIVHRLAGRTAQMGASDLAQSFRALELEINEQGLNDNFKKDAFVAIENLQKLIEYMRDESNFVVNS
jgi:signal transduction histidine kinase/FixJ family two-component response regulator